MFDQKVDRPYLLGSLAWVSAFIVALLVAMKLSGQMAPDLRWLPGLLPAIPALWGMRVEFGWIRRSDEMHQRIYLESLFYGSYLFTSLGLVVYCMHRLGGLPLPPFDLMFLSFIVCNLCGWLAARRRYT